MKFETRMTPTDWRRIELALRNKRRFILAAHNDHQIQLARLDSLIDYVKGKHARAGLIEGR